MKSFLILVALLLVSTNCFAPLFIPNKNPIPDEYIVLFHDNTTDEELASHLYEFKDAHDVDVENKYEHTVKGFAARLSKHQLLKVRNHGRVAMVEQNQILHMYPNTVCFGQDHAGWGLERISKYDLSLNGSYHFPNSAGDGVDAYIIDTGIFLEHEDFQSRAVFGFKAEQQWPSTDDQGHGTHVASTVGGLLYGAAKRVTLIAVKVLGSDGSGTLSGVIDGIDWAVKSAKQRKRPSVGNLSLGGSKSQALNNAVEAATASGLNLVVAAGNENQDACNTSPASAKNVITVGASDSTDSRSYFSNYGKCVTLFAPGSDIKGAWIGDTDATNTISGTSMASPHVCGISALLLSQNPSLSFPELKAKISAMATAGKLELKCIDSACKVSPNLLGFNGC